MSTAVCFASVPTICSVTSPNESASIRPRPTAHSPHPAVLFRREHVYGIDRPRSEVQDPATLARSAGVASPAASHPEEVGSQADPEEATSVAPTHGITERPSADGRIRYRVRVSRSGQSFNGTFPTREEALAFQAQAVAATEGRAEAPQAPRRATGPSVPDGRAQTVEDAARRLARGMRDGTVRTNKGLPFKPSTMRKYEEALRCLVLPRMGAVPIRTLSGGDVQRLIDGLAAERTPEHARKALTALRVALRLALRYGEIDANPCARVTVPTSAEGERPAYILTPEDADAIVRAAYADDERLARSFGGALTQLAFATGLRQGELLALPWGSEGLDLSAGIVRVRRSLDRVRGDDGAFPFVPPKSRASRREVPIASEEIAAMRRHLLASGRPIDGRLVFAPEGGPLSPSPARRSFRRACYRAGVFLDHAPDEIRGAKTYAEFERRCRELKCPQPLPRFHDARHAYATHLLAAGLTAHAVAKLLGHSDVGLVLRRYGHALPDEVASAAARLDAFRKARGL